MCVLNHEKCYQIESERNKRNQDNYQRTSVSFCHLWCVTCELKDFVVLGGYETPSLPR